LSRRGLPAQQAIRRWFDRKYAAAGLSYLRPPEFYSIFLDYLEARPGDRLLDVGCGPGLLLGEAARRGVRACGVDLSAVALAMARKRTPAAGLGLCNAERLCWADDTFDHVTSIGVFEHCLDPGSTLAEMWRVLKPGGRICVMVPNSRTLKWKIEADLLRRHDPDSNERAATLDEWRQVFLANGLAIERIHRDEWPRYARRRRLLGRAAGEFTAASRPRHLLPLAWANQFVFLLHPYERNTP
jgi:SAM-dependent methyltransferase